ncbi:hypothetical protein LX16_1113 [Stackebrandtia albiflava]|uniref:Uncharacterized protein n=1 Tax=Stackebrandtia albiflava TaxID=406432 RepID=A0A562VC20_9ACTN|nr:hypothetical protein [Stackebrandtia albiflava]TWJ15410.1 hypothetical protein LX16_1113 [Stackebrandtia albiflava]
MTAYTRCPDCDAARTVTGVRATADDPGTEEPRPCPHCEGTGCVPFQGYILTEPETDR